VDNNLTGKAVIGLSDDHYPQPFFFGCQLHFITTASVVLRLMLMNA
jgi:hypothetical protein